MKKQSGFQLLRSAKWYAFRRPWQALLRLSLFDRRSRRRGSAERGSVPRKHIRPAIQPASGSVGLQLATAAAAQVAVTDFLIIMTKTYVTHAILFLFSEVASCLPSRFPPFSFCFHTPLDTSVRDRFSVRYRIGTSFPVAIDAKSTRMEKIDMRHGKLMPPKEMIPRAVPLANHIIL